MPTCMSLGSQTVSRTEEVGEQCSKANGSGVEKGRWRSGHNSSKQKYLPRFLCPPSAIRCHPPFIFEDTGVLRLGFGARVADLWSDSRCRLRKSSIIALTSPLNC